MDPVKVLIDQLESNPSRFRSTGGYERLLNYLRKGIFNNSVNKALQQRSEHSGDLLWTIAELENVSPFASNAAEYISSPDKGTAAYAMEIVLRGSVDPSHLRNAIYVLNSCDEAVCEHVVRTLAGQGILRLVEILTAADLSWTKALAKELSGQTVRREAIEGLIADQSRDRQVLGVTLATLAAEQDSGILDYLKSSDQHWIREYGEWLEQG